MLKKTLAATALAGALLFGTAAAAVADDYPTSVPVSASAATVEPGGSIVITASNLGDHETVTFVVSGPSGATLASIAFASAAPGASVVKPVVNEVATATLTPAGEGVHTVTVLAPDGTVLGTTTVTAVVAAAGGGSSTGGSSAGGSGLPATGGPVPAAAIWAGVGALGLGGIAVAAVAARRRTQNV